MVGTWFWFLKVRFLFFVGLQGWKKQTMKKKLYVSKPKYETHPRLRECYVHIVPCSATIKPQSQNTLTIFMEDDPGSHARPIVALTI